MKKPKYCKCGHLECYHSKADRSCRVFMDKRSERGVMCSYKCICERFEEVVKNDK